MSKIVMLSAQLGAPQIMNDLLDQLKAKNPQIAQFIEQLDTIPLINECAQNALNFLARQDGISKDQTISDFYGKSSSSYGSQKIIGALKTKTFDKGLGIIVDKDGSIKFVGDIYRSEWKQEADRLTKLYQEAFMAECVKMILQIMGYQVSIKQEVRHDQTTGRQTVLSAIEGVKS